MGELFEAARRGDRAGQEEIARLVKTFARAVCRGGGPPGAPDLEWQDVSQETLRKLFSVGLEQYLGQGTERSYLFSMVKSTMIQMSRTANRRRGREQAAIPDASIPPHNPGPQLLVAKILGLIPQECRDLLTCVFLYGETYADLARELGLMESSVRGKVSRCMQKARTAATEAGFE